jgi:hypothetical protein
MSLAASNKNHFQNSDGLAPSDISHADFKNFTKRLGSVYQASVTIFESRNPGCVRTGLKLYQNDPRRYTEIVIALMDGKPATAVAREFKVPLETVRGMRSLHSEAMNSGKAQILSHLEEASLCLARRLADEAPQIPLAKVPQALAISIEKHQLLSGGVTQRTEHLNAPKPEDLKAMFDALPRANVTELKVEDKPERVEAVPKSTSTPHLTPGKYDLS